MTKKPAPDTPLMNALVLLGLVVERRTAVPILTNVAVTVLNGTLFLEATDLDVEVAIEVEPANVPDYTVTASHETLRNIAAEHDGIVGYSPDLKSTRLVAVADICRYDLATLPACDFPHFSPDFAPAHSFKVPGAQLLADLLAVRFGISTEETRYYLNGVYMHIQPATGASTFDHLRFAATDGYRLFMIQRPLPAGLADMPGVIIPRKVIKVLIAALERDAGDEVTVEIAGGVLRFILPGVTIKAKAIDGTFPDYSRVIPTGNETVLKVKASDLAAAAGAAGAIASERTRALAIHFRDNGESFICAKSPENGEMNMPLPGEVTGPLLPLLGLNVAYLRDCCAPFGDAIVTVAMDGGASPVLIEHAVGPAGYRLTVVQMPMRVS